MISIPFFTQAQIDTVESGTVTFIDSALGLKFEIPFKKRMTNGVTKGYYLESNSLAVEGNTENNQKQGVWNYYQYNSVGDKIVNQFFNYKNDTLQGPFMKRDDSLVVIGTYVNDTLEGAYKEAIASLDDSLNAIYTPIDSGQYAMGVQYGLWTYLKNESVIMEGAFENGKKHLHWKMYDTVQLNPQTLMHDVQFFEGVKTGNEIIYFHYENGKKIVEQEIIPWQMGKLSGNYSKKNETGLVLEEGMYSDDIKIGKWNYRDAAANTAETVTYLNNQLNGPYKLEKETTPIVEGTYAQDKKNKTWSYYNESGSLIREEHYKDGAKTEEWKFYNAAKKWTHSLVFEDDMLVELYRFDNNGDENLAMQLQKEGAYLKITAEETMVDSNISKDVVYKLPEDTVNGIDLLNSYIKSGSDSSIFIKNGGFSVTKSGSTEYQGVFKGNVKHGEWSYYYNPRIVWKKEFDQGILSKETHDTVVRFAPPLVISKAQIDVACDIIENLIGV